MLKSVDKDIIYKIKGKPEQPNYEYYIVIFLKFCDVILTKD